jgi:hypothetical protein
MKIQKNTDRNRFQKLNVMQLAMNFKIFEIYFRIFINLEKISGVLGILQFAGVFGNFRNISEF